MTGMIKALLQVSAIVLLPLSAFQSARADWTGGLEAGTQLGSGENPTLRFYARDDGDPLSHYIYLDWTRENSGQSYRLGYNPVFNMSRSLYSFGKFRVEEDVEWIIEQQRDALLGLGNHIHRTRTSLLTLELGGGVQQFRFKGGSDDQTEGFLYLGANYYQILFETFRFNATVDTRSGESQNMVDAEAGISIRLSPTTALKYAFRYRRYGFDDASLDTVVDEDSFFTVTYGF